MTNLGKLQYLVALLHLELQLQYQQARTLLKKNKQANCILNIINEGFNMTLFSIYVCCVYQGGPFPLAHFSCNFNKLPNPKKQILSRDGWVFQRTRASTIYITSSRNQAKVVLNVHAQLGCLVCNIANMYKKTKQRQGGKSASVFVRLQETLWQHL